ncbi:MAG: aminodeoxyfutalosine deaminase [Gaiellales bacterium]|jgi:5-methylthioadenosine/S-adenosylhomocysteine deaminase|nr:aminodeoxyfutalosine deaminase [Gaiellales bacterium]
MILGADWVLPMDGPPVRDGAVRIEGGVIAEVSAALTPDQRFAGGVILPGLVNAHTHVEYLSMSAMADGLPFTPWIEQLIVRKRGLGRDDYLAQAEAGVQACLAGGVTTIADCSYADTVAEAAIAQGLRAIVYLEAFSDQGDPAGLMAARLDALPADELITPGVSPHAPYTVTVEHYAELIALARSRGIPVATHLLESERDTRPLAELEHVLGPDTVGVHLVRATAGDIALLARLDVPVVHCPRSNALLGCGTAPLPELLAAGLAVGLGTDSPASALSFDMWDEMRAAILLGRARAERPDALTAEQALRMATSEGARAIGLGDRVGSLTAGKRADLTVLDLTGSPYLPWDDPVTAAVYGGTADRVLLTMVEGRLRYSRDGAPADTKSARAVRAKMIER